MTARGLQEQKKSGIRKKGARTQPKPTQGPATKRPAATSPAWVSRKNTNKFNIKLIHSNNFLGFHRRQMRAEQCGCVMGLKRKARSGHAYLGRIKRRGSAGCNMADEENESTKSKEVSHSQELWQTAWRCCTGRAPGGFRACSCRGLPSKSEFCKSLLQRIGHTEFLRREWNLAGNGIKSGCVRESALSISCGALVFHVASCMF